MQITIQQNEQDCGLYVVKALAEYIHSFKIDVNKLRLEAPLSSKGISAYDLCNLAKTNGVILNPFSAKVEEVLKNKNEYFVAGIKNKNFNHYVIIEIKTDYVAVYDPAKGKYKLLFSEFASVYNELVFTIDVGKLILKKESKKNQIKVFTLVFHNTKVIFMSVILIFILLIFSFVSTFFMKIVFDKIIPSQAFNLLSLISIFFSAISIIRVFTNYLKQLFIKKLALELEFILYRSYKAKLVTAHLKNIARFEKSDLLRRMTLIESSSVFLSSSIFILIEEGMTLVIALAFLIYISPNFFAIVLASSLFTIFITLLFHFIIYPLYKEIFQDAIKNFSYQNIRVNEISSLKDQTYEFFSSDNLLNSFYELKKKEFRLWKMLSFKSIVEEIVASIVPIIITYIFVKQIFTNYSQPGQMLLFLTIASFFSSPLHSITDYFLKLKQNLINLNYIKKVLDLNDEPINPNGMQIARVKKLRLDNIAFSYTKPVLNIEKLELDDSIRITSTNGTGKSTLLKLIALRFLPNFGYKINGMDYSFYNLNSIRDNFFFLESNHYLPASRITSFVTLNDSNLIATFEHNMQKYSLNNFLSKNKIYLNDFLKEGGINLSSGQKQIILLLRLFTKKYSLIVLDEALENVALDNLLFLKASICDFQDEAIFVEVSHTRRYLKNGKEVNLEKINKVCF